VPDGCRAVRGWRDRAVACSRGRESCAGEKEGSATGPIPVDTARSGSKHHLLVDATGILLAWSVTGGNRTDVTQLILLVDRIPPVRRRRSRDGRPAMAPAWAASAGVEHTVAWLDQFKWLLVRYDRRA
jgi:hypothetical protein